MNNNDILRRLRYTFDLQDWKVVEIFAQADFEVTRAEVMSWLKKDEDADFRECNDMRMAAFLNGFINSKRGKKEGEQPKPVQRLDNNAVFRKLKIALDLKAEDIIETMTLADAHISKHELSAFFRKPEHKNYRECKDQVLRLFLKGLQIKHRGDEFTKRDSAPKDESRPKGGEKPNRYNENPNATDKPKRDAESKPKTKPKSVWDTSTFNKK